MTIADREVTDELFSRMRQFFSDDELIELTATSPGRTRRVSSIGPCVFHRSGYEQEVMIHFTPKGVGIYGGSIAMISRHYVVGAKGFAYR